MSDSLWPHGILQARILEWVAFPFSRESSQLRSPTLQADSLPAEPQGKPKNTGLGSLFLLQRIFLTQELNRGFLHCRRILCQLSYERSPVQSVSRVQLFATPWTAVLQAFLFFTVSRSLLKFMSIESVMLSNHLILCHPLLLLPSIFPSISLFKWVSSSHQRAKVLEFQLQHQSFQWIFRVDFLWDWLVSFPCNYTPIKIKREREYSKWLFWFGYI